MSDPTLLTIEDVRKYFQGNGKRKTAIARFRRLVALACEYLPAEQINCLSFHIAAYVDAAVGRPNLTRQFGEELDAEHSKVSGSSCPELSPADRKLLRQFGIKG